ncbi:MAG: di-trans,poly-cis-decaprenylcistransferase [Rickettsiales bacterium]|jgi:undecaprenyl diphosphate synthase|nr:di-trans,poly-cis-decaprenylcistransferase [Rickettsiales bacterium]
MQHIAIIMDGNRRWARQNGLSIDEGHKMGMEKIKDILNIIKKNNIKYFTIFTFSNENWKRDKEEVDDLMNIIENYISTEKDEFKKNDVKVKVIGRCDKVRDSILKKISLIEENTKDCQSMQFNIAFNYGGRQEIIDAVKKIVALNTSVDDIDEKLFEKYLYYGSGVPCPDLIIRTGGESRMSNFLLWEMAYSELYFTDVFWPDFNEKLFYEIIDCYNKRERRYGR